MPLVVPVSRSNCFSFISTLTKVEEALRRGTMFSDVNRLVRCVFEEERVCYILQALTFSHVHLFLIQLIVDGIN